jgi:pyrroline-5-carboxylate reductase
VWVFLSSTRVAVIGAGRIGSSIIRELLECGALEVMATGRRRETLERAARLGARATANNREAVEKAGLVFLSVKPVHYPAVAGEIGGVVEGRVVVSVMAGVRLDTLRATLPGALVYRAMPNINAMIGASSTAVSGDRSAQPAAMLVQEALQCIGSVYWVPEEWMDAWTALAGSAPAFVAELVDAMVLGAMATGMPRDIAEASVLDTLGATARLLARRKVHPAYLRDEVTTPAGTTIEGLKILEKRGVKYALIEAIEETARKASLLGRRIDEQIRRRLQAFIYKDQGRNTGEESGGGQA